MPQYVMPIEDRSVWDTLSSFEQGYIECALFCGVERKEGDPLADVDKRYDAAFDEITAETFAEMRADCRKFIGMACNLLLQAHTKVENGIAYDAARAGNDFWYTRNGHGVGFWDRVCLTKDCDLGDRLTAIAKQFGEYSLFTADDGTVYGVRG